MRFNIFQIILTEDINLFTRLRPRRSRRDVLADALSRDIEFTHKGIKHYVMFLDSGADILSMKLGKEGVTDLGEPPERRLSTKYESDWKRSQIFINIDYHPGGQKLFVEVTEGFRAPFNILQSFAYAVNKKLADDGWIMSISTLSDEESFWQAAEKYRGYITEVEFTFFPPNILGLSNKTSETMKEAQNRFNATIITESVRNPNGQIDVNSDDQGLQESWEQARGGQAVAKIKVGQRTVFDSRWKTKSATVVVKDVEQVSDEVVGRKTLIKRLFGK